MVTSCSKKPLRSCGGDPSSLPPQIDLQLGAAQHYIDGDAARIQQVFWNLIRNAVKFTALDGRIIIRTENPDANTFRVEVIDTGIGIAPEALPKIFNAFEQGDTDINRAFGGLGLGLAISHALAELHGGTLRAESAGVGKGATFIFELPAIEGSSIAPEVAAALPAGTGCRRILLVEDHATTAALMARLLRKRGHHVELAHNKKDAIAIGLRDEFDVIISDLGLPDGTGFEVMEALRSKSRAVGIALTGYGMEADVAQTMKAGFQFHLTKPVDAQKLYQAIEQIPPPETHL